MSFTPVYYGNPDGTNGLSSVSDLTYYNGQYQVFGSGGYYEAKQGIVSYAYSFYFKYNDGSYYYGQVFTKTQVYFSNSTVYTNFGTYIIEGNAALSSVTPGSVYIYGYYDASSTHTYTPKFYGYADGTGGLGTEGDYISGNKGVLPFGFGGALEAKQA